MKIRYSILLIFFLALSSFKSEKRITVFTIGDSTMANKSLNGDNQERGWAQMLPGFFTEDIVVDNHAKNGRSSKSFIDEGLWDEVLKRIKPGDYLFIQFGHNDEKPKADRHTEPGGSFDKNLERFVKEARDKGAIPVLFNSIVRRHFASGDTLTLTDNYRGKDNTVLNIAGGDTLIDTHGKYLDSPRNVAKKMGVAFIDMNKLTHDFVEKMGNEESKKLFMWIPEGKYVFAPQGKKDNTHLNIYGARKLAALAARAIEEKVPALGKYIRYYDFVVAKDGSGDFFTVQDAIIFGEEMSTSGSSTCYIYAPDFYAENITFRNGAGRVGQAVACFVSGDRAHFKNCRFIGNQDTLYTYGKDSRQYYENCYVEGTVDFIFGKSTALFMNCTIKSLSNGYVTAPATEKGNKYGYVFINCDLTSSDGVDNVFLSRPWRPYA